MISVRERLYKSRRFSEFVLFEWIRSGPGRGESPPGRRALPPRAPPAPESQNYYTWIIQVIFKQHLVQIGRIDRHTVIRSRLEGALCRPMLLLPPQKHTDRYFEVEA